MDEATQPMPAITDDDDLMTTYEVAMLFRTTSVAVVRWTQRNDPPLTPVPTDNGRRFRESEVRALYASGFHGEPSAEWRKKQDHQD